MAVFGQLALQHLLKAAKIPLQAATGRHRYAIAKALRVHGIASQGANAGHAAVQQGIDQGTFPGLGGPNDGNLQGIIRRIGQHLAFTEKGFRQNQVVYALLKV